MPETLIISLTPSDSLLGKHFKCLQVATIETFSQFFTQKNNPLRLTYFKLNLGKAFERVGF